MHKRVLVVDDDDPILEIVRHFLEQEGYEVLTAENPDDALFAAHMHAPDAIILDVLLPHMDGFDICTMLQGHEDTRHIPILFLTGTSDPLGRLKAKYAGGSEWVSKPFKKDDLLSALNRMLAAPSR